MTFRFLVEQAITSLQARARTLLFVAGAGVVYLCAQQGPDFSEYAASAQHLIDGSLPTDHDGATNIVYRKHSWGVSALLAPFVYGSGADENSWRLIATSLAAYLVVVPLIWMGFSTTLDEEQATIAVLCLMLASPVGYYMTHIGAEAMVLPALAGLWLFALGYRSKHIWWDIVAIASLLALVGMCRIYLLCFGLPAVVRYSLDHTNVRTRIGLAVAKMSATFVAVGTTAFQNRALTGDWFQSPYDFGDAQWRSLQLSHCPFGWDALFSPYHGFVAFHPLCGIGLIACVCLPVVCWREGRKAESLMWLAASIAAATNVWFVGSYYYWDMASLFGTRGLVPIIFPAAFGLGRLATLKNVNRTFLSTLLLAGVVWSLLLMSDEGSLSMKYPQHDYANYGQLAWAVVAGIPSWFALPRLGVLLGLTVVSCLLWQRSPYRLMLIPLSAMALAFAVAMQVRSVSGMDIGVLLVASAGIFGIQKFRDHSRRLLISLQAYQLAFALLLIGRAALNTKVVVLDRGAIEYTADIRAAAKRFSRIPQFQEQAAEIDSFMERHPETIPPLTETNGDA